MPERTMGLPVVVALKTVSLAAAIAVKLGLGYVAFCVVGTVIYDFALGSFLQEVCGGPFRWVLLNILMYPFRVSKPLPPPWWQGPLMALNRFFGGGK